jgi:cytochrome P450
MTIRYDPFSSEIRKDPFPHYAQLREEAPVHRLSERLWAISRYDDCSFVMRNPDLFSSSATRLMMMGGLQSGMQADEAELREARRRRQQELGLESLVGSDEGWNENSLISLDPPNHDKVRHIVNRGFTPRRVAELGPRIREISEACVDRILEQGEELDLTSDYSTPIPLQVMAELLGVDAGDADDFQRWSEIVISGITGEMAVDGFDRLLITLQELAEYFLKIAEDRRKRPRNDLISVLVAAEESETLSPVEVVNFATLLLAAGNETTTHLIDNAVLAILDHPHLDEKVRSNPDLVSGWVEETLRWDGPVQLAFRQTTRDLELGGTPIPEGDILTVLFGSANRDDAFFPNGDAFDITRDTQGHMGFGFGVHFCLGASLARLEAKVALETLIRRLPELHRTDEPLERFDSFLVRGPIRLPLRYDASQC